MPLIGVFPICIYVTSPQGYTYSPTPFGSETAQRLFNFQISATCLIFYLVTLLHKSTVYTKDLPDSNPVSFSFIIINTKTSVAALPGLLNILQNISFTLIVRNGYIAKL